MAVTEIVEFTVVDNNENNLNINENILENRRYVR